MIERAELVLAILGAFSLLLIVASWTALLVGIWRACERTADGVARVPTVPAAARAPKGSIGYTAPPRGDDPPKGSDE